MGPPFKMAVSPAPAPSAFNVATPRQLARMMPGREGIALPPAPATIPSGLPNLQRKVIQRTKTPSDKIRIGSVDVELGRLRYYLQRLCTLVKERVSTLVDALDLQPVQSPGFAYANVQDLSGYVDVSAALNRLSARVYFSDTTPEYGKISMFPSAEFEHLQEMIDFNRQGPLLTRDLGVNKDPLAIPYDKSSQLKPLHDEVTNAWLPLAPLVNSLTKKNKLKKTAKLNAQDTLKVEGQIQNVKEAELDLASNSEVITKQSGAYENFIAALRFYIKDTALAQGITEQASAKIYIRSMLRLVKGEGKALGNISELPYAKSLTQKEFLQFVNAVLFGAEGHRNPMMWSVNFMHLHNVKHGRMTTSTLSDSNYSAALVDRASMGLSLLAQEHQAPTNYAAAIDNILNAACTQIHSFLSSSTVFSSQNIDTTKITTEEQAVKAVLLLVYDKFIRHALKAPRIHDKAAPLDPTTIDPVDLIGRAIASANRAPVTFNTYTPPSRPTTSMPFFF
jgi:hypothetical protein